MDIKKFFNKLSYNSPVVLTFAIVSFVVLILGYVTDGMSTTALFCVYRTSFDDPLAYVRLFTHVLGHADMEHYVNNMMMFLLLGPIVEEKYGSKLLVGMFLITAAITGIFNMLFFATGLLGASGLVFMLIILSSTTSVTENKIPITLILVVILYLGGQVYSGLFTKDNISQFTHILGGICGGSFGLFLGRKKK